MVLRSPLRRLGLMLLGPFILFSALDLVRASLAQRPRVVAADELELGFAREYVTAVGLARLAEMVPYELATYYESRRFRSPVRVDPFVLVPLNVPERSGGRLLLAEVPLVDGGLPEGTFTSERFEFTGLAGPLPDDLRGIVARDFPEATQFARVQLRIGPPRWTVSLSWLCTAVGALLLVRWRAGAYERSEDAQAGYPQRVSRVFLVLGLPLPLVVAWMCARLDPEADDVGLFVIALGLQLLLLLAGSALRGRRLEHFDEELKDRELDAVAERESHEVGVPPAA